MAHFRSLAEAQEKADPSKPIFAWHDLKVLVGENALHVLGRHRYEEVRYQAWARAVVDRYGVGGMEKYLLTERLQWTEEDMQKGLIEKYFGAFKSTMDESVVKILRNDWPYSITDDVEHWVVWVRVPFLLESSDLYASVHHGLSGLILQCDTQCEEKLQTGLALEIRDYVLLHWRREIYETCYFLNPPKLQSVKGLGHFHVFSRRVDGPDSQDTASATAQRLP